MNELPEYLLAGAQGIINKKVDELGDRLLEQIQDELGNDMPLAVAVLAALIEKHLRWQYEQEDIKICANTIQLLMGYLVCFKTDLLHKAGLQELSDVFDQ